MTAISQRFDAAARIYDQAASVQAEVAESLVAWARPFLPPESLLDIGAGTGLVSQAALRRWPRVKVTAIDSAPAMLRVAQQKLPGLHVVPGDAASFDTPQRFDAAFSSMALHWLPDLRTALRRWRNWLKPGGHLYVALLAQDSFCEWRHLCVAEGLSDGLWNMPRPDFADGLASRSKQQSLTVTYDSAQAFLKRLKETGAATPREGHHSFNPAAMRRLLARAPKPFLVSYDILYIELPASSI